MTGGRPGDRGGASRSNSLRGPAPYLHSAREEQLYKLVSDLSDACRQDNNANALRDMHLIETLEKNAKDILSHRSNNNSSMIEDKRRRLSVERNANSDDEGARLGRDRSVPQPTAPTRYNMPTFFSRSNLGPSMRGPPAKPARPPARSGMAAFADDDDDDDHIPNYASRETAINARDALCSLDALSTDELDMLGSSSAYGDDKRDANDDEDIESIMNHAKGSVLNQYGPPSPYGQPQKPRANSREIFRQTTVERKTSAPTKTSSQSMVQQRSATFLDAPKKSADGNWKEGGDYVYTHLGSKIFGKATKDKLISVSSSSLGPRSKPSFADPKLSEVSSPQAKVSLMGRSTGSGDSYGGSESDDGYLPLRGYQSYQKESTSPDTRRLDVLERDRNALQERLRSMEADFAAKIASLEASVAEKEARCVLLSDQVRTANAATEALTHQVEANDAQWKTQFEAAHASLEATLARLEQEKASLLSRLETYEPKRPSSINLFAQRIIWHLKEILREDEAEASSSSEQQSEEARAKATRVSALVNRFEKSNAQVQANFAQQLRHDIKTIGIRAFEEHPENVASKAKLLETIADLEAQLKEQSRAMDALSEEAKNQQSQLEMALQTAMERDADVMDLESQIQRLAQTNDAATNSAHDATLLLLKDKTSQLADARAAMAQLEADVSTLNEHVAQLTSTAEAREKDLSAARAALISATRDSSEANHVAELTQALEAATQTHATQLRAASTKTQDEIAALKAQIVALTKVSSTDAAAYDALSAAKTKIAAQEAELSTLQATIEDLRRQLEDALAPTINPMPADECVKKVRFEDDVLKSADSTSTVHLQHILKKRDEELHDLKTELYERACDVNALRAEVLGKTETIELLSKKLAAKTNTSLDKAPTSTMVTANPQTTSMLLANPDMAKMEMFLFNSLCAKQQEVDDLLVELDRREEAVRAVCAAEIEALQAEVKVLEERYTEMSTALKLAHEQQSHLETETDMQLKSIENKQKQIKSLISLMAEKEAELAELDEALAIAEMQVEHLKATYHVSFTLEQEEAFATAYEEGGRMSSFSMKAGRESFAERGKFFERMSLHMDDTDFEIEDLAPFRSRASSTNSLLSDKGTRSSTTQLSATSKPFEDDMEYGSPRFSNLSYGSARDSNISVTEWDPEF
ncbi:hypothetical protein SPRG_10451 [Saprolegnia parasitica CBS 223.65]|uniref:Uncharacterized protein n=1 Tax=Saprolegnia parasitica (strain CBS 223.65) TaxID=695850 RepID=A0A067C1H3_SAPPC|nr:hypothetical protein SPRG_10451 [Saprolegnia parasitica CBS 223.65]KDO24373.1 hypothetical protein SPRG_10451 [Saprolegnia parasitica CBS 223.65]|eukprot:XP_012204966.1 hypothetical protein SPRG_10451 [Saprolegnia parasitica CBS 223.65]